jgi:hypothetical protein
VIEAARAQAYLGLWVAVLLDEQPEPEVQVVGGEKVGVAGIPCARGQIVGQSLDADCGFV